MKTIYDQGHHFELLALDGDYKQDLRFVKRMDRDRPSKFPGNNGAYPGTTLQSVIRCLLNRMRYLQAQHWCPENMVITGMLRWCLWLLEFRAARRHHRVYFHTLGFAEYRTMCPECGHTDCEHQRDKKP